MYVAFLYGGRLCTDFVFFASKKQTATHMTGMKDASSCLSLHTVYSERTCRLPDQTCWFLPFIFAWVLCVVWLTWWCVLFCSYLPQVSNFSLWVRGCIPGQFSISLCVWEEPCTWRHGGHLRSTSVSLIGILYENKSHVGCFCAIHSG